MKRFNIGGKDTWIGTAAERAAATAAEFKGQFFIEENTAGGPEFFSDGTNWNQISTGGAAYTIPGGPGGTANTAITSFPFTLATHTGTGAGTAYNLPSGRVTLQASSDASHTGSSIIDIEVSNDNVGWEWIARLTVTGNSDTALASIDDNYAYIRSNCTAHGDSTNTVTVTINL